MEVAVGVNRHRLLLAQVEHRCRLVTGLEVLAQAAVLGLDVDPLDQVLLHHGVIHRAHVDGQNAVLVFGDGQVLLTAGLDGVGLQSLHLFAAAHHGDTGVVDSFDKVAAVTADKEFGHCIFSFRFWYWRWFASMALLYHKQNIFP